MGTIESMKEKYETLCAEHGNALNEGDSKRANFLHKKIMLLIQQAKYANHFDIFLPFLESKNENVKLWTATGYLQTHPLIALKALEELSKSPDFFINWKAKATIKLYKNGEWEQWISKKPTITKNILNSTLQLSDSIVLTIKEAGSSKKASTILLILSLISLCIPIAILIYMLQLSEGLSIGFFISCLIFATVFIYFFRLYLWNKYGKEVIIINKDTVTTYFDYKYFKDKYQEVHYDTITVLAEHRQKMRKVNTQLINDMDSIDQTYIGFLINDKIISTQNMTSVQLALKIAQHIKTISKSQQ